MNDEPAKAEWRNAPAFAEMAEALGITTIDVLAAWSDGQATYVLFTRDYASEDSLVLQATLQRDADGIYVVTTPERPTEFRVADLFKARS